MKNKEFLSNCTIIYIEDDDIIRQYISEFLGRYCKNLFTVQNAEAGLDLYNSKKPDIMIIDINLPGMSGLELITLIRKNDEKTRVLVTTAYTNKEFTIAAIELSLTRYLVKPVTSSDLKDALKKAITEFNKVSNKISNIDLGDGFIYNLEDNFIIKGDSKIILRHKEKQLLDFFIENENKIVSYESLENKIWSDEIMTQNAIRSQIKNIRSKTHQKILINISKIGYKLYTKDSSE